MSEFNSFSGKRKNLRLSAVAFALLFFAPGAAGISQAEDATSSGRISVPYPTITNLSVEWEIQGDDNLNGVVAVQYRRVGKKEWNQGMSLRRIPAGKSINARPTFVWENKHSGSIFDLRPGTEYEIQLKLTDPDGGSAERTVRAKTRAVPKPAANATIRRVSPRDFKEAAATVLPGEILLLSPGYYGDFIASRDGEPDKPIVIRADRAHKVINSTFDSVSLRERKHVILEEVTVNGSVDLLNAEEVAVRRCQVNARFGIIAKSPPGAKNCYIADNVVVSVMPWVKEGMGAEMIYGGPGNIGEGIQITGPGNVICHNRVAGYRDCISTMEDRGIFDQRSIDIYNNDIYVGADDGIEADFCMGNCRIMRNRLTNCFMGLSSQPGLGGPTYFIRNVMYNIIDCPFKLSRQSKGDVVLHNTVVKVGDGLRVVHNPSRALFRNNLCIGGTGGGKFGRYGSGTGLAVFFPNADSTCDLDYDGVGTYQTPFKGQIGAIQFESFHDFTRLTTEKHGVLVDTSVFNEAVEFPSPPIPEREPPDLRIKAGSAAVDAGFFIPNVNNRYTGSAPDLGAYEVGQKLPIYGPRPEGVDEETLWQERNVAGVEGRREVRDGRPWLDAIMCQVSRVKCHVRSDT